MLKHGTSAEQGAGQELHSSLSSVQAVLFDGDVHPAWQMQRNLGSPACTRVRSSQMPCTQRISEPPSQSSYLEAHWGPWVSGEQRQL